uniref:VWFD domain-containing protein n=1 Tax=Acrobeloides nanus TaxID=290746 RepID=A0A914DTN1_9BILA
MPPHCIRAVVTTTQPSQLNESIVNILRKQLKIGVGQTICFKIIDDQGGGGAKNPSSRSNKLHTLTLGQLEQYYSITQRYKFAIPEVTAKCICECNPEAATCRSMDYQYAACPNGNSNRMEACHRTFFDKQPITGCPTITSNSSPKLCCELKFRPYQNRTFTALKLEPASTFAILRYSAFEWSGGRWQEDDSKTIRVNLDGGTHHQYLDSEQDIEMAVNAPGKATNQLSPGMYFVENLERGSYGEIVQQPLNEITEHNFHKLGWYRIDAEDQFFVHYGNFMMDKVHHAFSEHCQDQKFQTILDASYYINHDANDSTRFNLAETLNSTMRWIKSARVVDSAERHAMITENEGSNLEVTLNAKQNEQLQFIHNASRISDFNGNIVIDRHSNAFLNITVFNASGILNGYLKEAEEIFNQYVVDSFTVYIPESMAPEKQVLVRVKPYPTNVFVKVCIRPEEGLPNSEICRFVRSMEEELVDYEVKNSWEKQVGNCPACNKFMDDFIKNLNPLEWCRFVRLVEL